MNDEEVIQLWGQVRRNALIFSPEMEAACSSKTSVSAFKTTWQNNPEDQNLNNHCHKHLKI
jgi:hypothetical protein